MMIKKGSFTLAENNNKIHLETLEEIFMKIVIDIKLRSRFKDESTCIMSFFGMLVSIERMIELLQEIEYTNLRETDVQFVDQSKFHKHKRKQQFN